VVRSPSLKGITVLLVDDDPDELALLGTVLAKAGAAVTAVPKRCGRCGTGRRAWS
jgi:CheY-like chemotaxis protein